MIRASSVWNCQSTPRCFAFTDAGHVAHSIRDAAKRGYRGFAVMEPHLRGGGPTGGHTGPDLFPAAVEAFRTILKDAGGQEA